jgi:hypothetical protein
VLQAQRWGAIRFTLPGGDVSAPPGGCARELSAQRLGLSDGRRGTFEVTCLIAREIAPPPGVKPIELRLLTHRRAEALQLSTLERIERALALFLVVAWHIAQLMRLGRTLPDLDAALLLEPEEWQAAYILAKKALLRQPARLNAVLRLIAQFGGFLGRKDDGQHGVKAIWLGRQRVMDFAAGSEVAW